MPKADGYVMESKILLDIKKANTNLNIDIRSMIYVTQGLAFTSKIPIYRSS